MRRFDTVAFIASVTIVIVGFTAVVLISSTARPVSPVVKAESFYLDNDCLNSYSNEYRRLHRVETPFGWLVIRGDEMIHVSDPNHVWSLVEIESR